MPRTLVDEWPSYSDSLGDPDSGTTADAELLDAARDAIASAIYDEDLDEEPSEITAEVVEARGSFSSLDSRLDSIAAAAAGGAAVITSGQLAPNLVPNDSFLIWSGGDSAAPDYWSVSGLTVARVGFTAPTKVPGRNYVRLTGTGDFRIDLMTATDLTTFGGAPLAGLSVAAGVFIFTATPGLVEVYIDDGVDEYLVGGNGSTVDEFVWSADLAGANNGAATLDLSPTRLRLIVRLDGGTADIAGAYFGFANSAPRYQPSSAQVRDMVWSHPSNVAAPDSTTFFTFSPAQPIYIYSGKPFCKTAGASGSVFNVKKNGTEIFTTPLTLASGQTTAATEQEADSVAKASIGPTDILTMDVGTLAAAMRGPTIRLRAISYADPVLALISGRVAV